MNTALRVVFSGFIFGLLSCAQFQQKSETKRTYQPRPAVKSLSQEQALWRAELVSDVHYEMDVKLFADQTDFAVRTKIKFNLKTDRHPLTIDFTEGTVHSINLNGHTVDTDAYNGAFITLQPTYLQKGVNVLVIEANHPTSQSGNGLHRFKDPEDNRVYLYTHFEPYSANKLFPCFDQPDIKATYTLKVEAPKEWQVISAMREERIKEKPKNRLEWIFPKTLPFSTYLISLHAGPYFVWTSRAGSIPLRLFARRSLAKYVRHEEWFRVTQQGFGFFPKVFGSPYPFFKYDQIIVPEFNMGAMENVAAVTFSERYIYRSTPTLEEREGAANTLLHEMAHMWFGNLVTMKWWNDLWLNESFATYMASVALARATQYTKAWQSFSTGTKQWAYWEDQLVTTHPIESEVADTSQAFANFDGITYGKGASSLKQLVYFIGEDAFYKGLAHYFKTHAYGNTERKDFMASLEVGSGKDLSEWTKEWLQTKGLQSIQVAAECAQGKITRITLKHSPPKNETTLSVHKTQLALLQKSGQRYQVIKKLDQTYRDTTEIPQLVGLTCPDMIFPNSGDHDYIKVQLDPITLQNVREGLSSIDDSFMRSMIWRTLWEQVRDAQLSLDDYTDIVIHQLPRERDMKTIHTVLDTLAHSRWIKSPSVLNYILSSPILEPLQKTERILQIEQFLWRQAVKSASGSDEQKRWWDSYVRTGFSDEAHQRFLKILAGKKELSGFILDQDRRWAVILQLSRLGKSEAARLIEEESQKDTSNRGKLARIAARSAAPNLEWKKEWLHKIFHEPEKYSFSDLRSAMNHLFLPGQEALLDSVTPEFFERLDFIAKQTEDDFQEDFVSALAPQFCSEKSVSRLEDAVESAKHLTPIMNKSLNIARQEDARCVHIQKFLHTELSHKPVRKRSTP